MACSPTTQGAVDSRTTTTQNDGFSYASQQDRVSTMKITAVRTIALGGATHDHGWPGGTDPNVQYNTLVEVVGDDGLTGIGSCYTTRPLVEGSLQLLREHLI